MLSWIWGKPLFSWSCVIFLCYSVLYLSALILSDCVYFEASCEVRASLEVEIMYLYAMSLWGPIKSYSGADVVHQVGCRLWGVSVRPPVPPLPRHTYITVYTPLWYLVCVTIFCLSFALWFVSFSLLPHLPAPPWHRFLMLPGKNLAHPFLFELLDYKHCWKEMRREKCIPE